MNVNWKALQNGSDIRGVAVEGIQGEVVNLDGNIVCHLGKAFYSWLQSKHGGSTNVSVGLDSRVSGPSLKQRFAEGILSLGGNIVDCGLASTPAMFMTTKDPDLNVQAGVMLTASHLPFNRNGLKFFTAEGGLNKTDIKEILQIAEENVEFDEAKKQGSVRKVNFIDTYAANMVETIRKRVNDVENFEQPLNGLKIIVDAGNGAGGFFENSVLLPLGADTEGSQFLDPDGMFPNHMPNPENKEAMESICKAVLNSKANLGIIFDTDVDRAAVVDSAGNPINRNALIALMSAIVLEEHPGSTIVTDSVTSDGLNAFIENVLKGKHHRFKRGYKNVINESIRLNETGVDSQLAIETSGHAALKENYFQDDGAYLVAMVLVKIAKLKSKGTSISELIKNLEQPAESEEYRLSLPAADHVSAGSVILESLAEITGKQEGWEIVQPNYEGIRVKCREEKGWFLLRLSLHDPLLVLNVESDTAGGCRKILSKLKEILSGFEQLDISGL
ncbi:phosphomannomutase/phosphoglucomutase [Bacteroidota bacterium]